MTYNIFPISSLFFVFYRSFSNNFEAMILYEEF